MSSNTPPSPSKNNAAAPNAEGEHKVSNFLRQIIENDLEKGTYSQRRWAGTPGDAAHHAAGPGNAANYPTRVKTNLHSLSLARIVQGHSLAAYAESAALHGKLHDLPLRYAVR